MATNEFQRFRRKQIAELRPWVPGDDMTEVSISDADRANGSPKRRDWIAPNPADHSDQWLVAEQNFEPV